MTIQQTIDNMPCTLYITENQERIKDLDKAVTISVGTYNSSKFILETLESAKAQAYPHLILQVSDDCSPDNTVEVCKQWIERNKERFIKTKIIVPDCNTGVTGNSNRAWDACETTYYKGIAGDDILLPNCIEEYMKYVQDNPTSILVFSRPKLFGLSEDECSRLEKRLFHFNFFEMTPQEQYDDIKYCSKLPAATAFVNIKAFRELGIRHDERIPMLEDRPKWINCIWKGVRFDFLDKQLVKYRLHEQSLSNTSILSPVFYKSTRLAFYYYIFAVNYKQDMKTAINEAVDNEMKLYEQIYYHTKRDRRLVNRIANKIIRILEKLRIVKQVC